MNFLADENVDQQIVDQLRKDGHEVLYVVEIEPGISDDVVLARANERSALLLTADKDFGELVFRQQRIYSGVILIRLAGLSPVLKFAHPWRRYIHIWDTTGSLTSGIASCNFNLSNLQSFNRSLSMSVDKMKGQIKEAAGKATGDKELEAEGKTDQVVADVKDTVSNVTETVKGVAESIKKTVSKAVKE